MSLVDEMRKLDKFHVFMGLVLFASVIAPGFIVIGMFRPALLVSLDCIKLLLLASSFSVPVLLLNGLVLIPMVAPASAVPDHADVFKWAAIVSAAEQYALLYVTYLLHLQFRTLTVLLAIATCVGLLLSMRYAEGKARKGRTPPAVPSPAPGAGEVL